MADLIRYSHTDLNLSISRPTISRILQHYNMISYCLPRKPRITPSQKRNRLQWCYEHLDWSVKDWSNIIFSDESNYEVLNRKNRIYIRRFFNDRTRFEGSQKRVHKGGGIGVWLYIIWYELGPWVIFNGRLNSIKYIDILEDHLSTALEKLPSEKLSKILYQHDNTPPHVSAMTKEYLNKKILHQWCG